MYIYIYIHTYIYIYCYGLQSLKVKVKGLKKPCSFKAIRPLHDISLTNMICCMALKGGVGGEAYIAQWACNSIAIGYALQEGGGAITG